MPQKKGIEIIDQFTQEPNWSMRYIIKRRLLIRAEARWVKCLLQRRDPDQLPCQCGWIGPHMDQCVIEPYGSAHCSLSFCGRQRDWKSDSQRYRQRTRFCHICSYGIEPTLLGFWRRLALCSSIASCTAKPVASKLCHPFSLLRSVFDLLEPTSGLRLWTRCSDDGGVWPRSDKSIDKVPVTVKFQVTASWSLLTLEVNGLPGGLENPILRSGTDCMQMSVNLRKDCVNFKGGLWSVEPLSHFITNEISEYYHKQYGTVWIR